MQFDTWRGGGGAVKKPPCTKELLLAALAWRNLLTLKLLHSFADLSAGLAGSAAAIGGQEERGDCET